MYIWTVVENSPTSLYEVLGPDLYAEGRPAVEPDQRSRIALGQVPDALGRVILTIEGWQGGHVRNHRRAGPLLPWDSGVEQCVCRTVPCECTPGYPLHRVH